MRALLPGNGADPGTPEGLRDRYRPAAGRWVRANMVASVDGAAAVDGRSGGLGSDADRRVFAVLREHADAVLVGAGTVRAEGYGTPAPDAEQAARRRAAGRTAAPRLAVVGRASAWTGEEAWITGAAAPPLLLTTAADAAEVAGAETVVCGDRRVDAAAALAALAERGLDAVLCEGGPSLLAGVARAGLDELCLTSSPLLAGPGAGRIVAGDAWPAARRTRLVDLIEDDGVLFARYAVAAD